MRRIVVAAVFCAAIGLSPSVAGAGPDDTFIFHFKGRAGSVVLTDCPAGAPVGTECRAVSVFAFEQRVNEDGEQLGGTGFNVSLFEVTIVGGEEGFIAEEIGFGFTDDATVKINGSLSKGAASATDVALCDDFLCPPGAPESISVSVRWSGFGPTSSFSSHDMFDDDVCFFNSRSSGALRFATAVGEVDGVAWVDPNLPDFPATLQSDAFGTIERCRLT